MPRGYRSIIVAIGLILIPLVVVGQSPENLAPDKPIEQPAADSQPAEQPAKESEPAVEPEPAAEAVAEEASGPIEPPEEAYDDALTHNEGEQLQGYAFKFWGDGLAQWVMAVFGVLAFGVSVWAVCLLRATLIETRKAVAAARGGTRAAIAAANAANAANKIILNASEVESRAYLAVEPMGVNQLIGRDCAIGLVQVRNVGKIPARQVSLSVHMEISWGPEPTHKDRRTNFVALVETKAVSQRVVQPGGTMRQGSSELLDMMDIYGDGRSDHNIYVWGVAAYFDGFAKEPRWTKFCHRYSVSSRCRDVDLNIWPTESRTIISADKARYHTYGNEAD